MIGHPKIGSTLGRSGRKRTDTTPLVLLRLAMKKPINRSGSLFGGGPVTKEASDLYHAGKGIDTYAIANLVSVAKQGL